MQVDFYDAHQRHWTDAELLFASARFANADHLYGFSAECGLKRLMVAFDMKLTDEGSPDKQSDRVHANKIWDRYETYRSKYGASQYTLPQQYNFSDWDAAQRYAHQSNFNKNSVILHQQAATAVRELIKKALLDGTL